MSEFGALDRAKHVGQELYDSLYFWRLGDDEDLRAIANAPRPAMPQLSEGDDYDDDDDHRGPLSRLESVVEELRDDLRWLADGVVEGPVGLATTAMALCVLSGAAPPAVPAWLTASSLGISSKYFLSATSALFVYNSYSVWNMRTAPTEGMPGICKPLAVSLATTGMYFLAVNSGYVIPPIYGFTVSNQELALRALVDLVNFPIIVRSLGHLSGTTTAGVADKLLTLTGANLCLLTAAAVPGPIGHVALGLGCGWLSKSMWDVSHDLPMLAKKVSSDNQMRVQVLTDLTVWSWAGTPTAISLSLLGLGHPELFVTFFVPLDIVSKLGSLMVLMRHKEIIARAYHYRRDRER